MIKPVLQYYYDVLKNARQMTGIETKYRKVEKNVLLKHNPAIADIITATEYLYLVFPFCKLFFWYII